MIEHIIKTIEKYKLIERNQHIIVGFSGGADSLFLVEVLLEYRKRVPFFIHCCHVNHLLRGIEALHDEEFCRQFCLQYNLPFYAFRIDIQSYSRKDKLSLEEAGRKIRYDRFHRIANKWANSKIAVAHHADDQVETILQNLIRGAAITGLAGMEFEKAGIVRPLLEIYKEDIIKYLQECDISYCIDSTNEENDYNRNRIRNLLIPSLEEYNPNFKASILRMSSSLHRDDDFLEQESAFYFDKVVKKDEDSFCYLDLDLWKELHPSLQYRIIIKLIEELKGNRKNIGQEHLDRITGLCSKEKGKKEYLAGYAWLKDQNRLWVYKEKKQDPIEINLILGKDCYINGYIIRADKIKVSDQKKRNAVYFSTDLLKCPLYLRNRKNGDRFFPFNAPGEKKLKDFFIDEKIPQFKRDRIPLLISEEKIIWIPGIRRSNWHLVQIEDEEVVEITWRKI